MSSSLGAVHHRVRCLLLCIIMMSRLLTKAQHLILMIRIGGTNSGMGLLWSAKSKIHGSFHIGRVIIPIMF
ncbi:protein of unknown function [Rhodovastum atsumiense]|nr:protein of unknown function [Rhodovastum atsumiense]